MSVFRKLFALALLSAIPALALAAEPFESKSIMLLQPDFILEERVPSIEALAAYLKAVQDTAAHVLADEAPIPTGGFLVLAVRPGGRSMAWLDLVPALPDAVDSKLRAAILRVPPFEARAGVVVVALKASLWGGTPSREFPHPAEWSRAMEGGSEAVEVGDLVNQIWPESPATDVRPETEAGSHDGMGPAPEPSHAP